MHMPYGENNGTLANFGLHYITCWRLVLTKNSYYKKQNKTKTVNDCFSHKSWFTYHSQYPTLTMHAFTHSQDTFPTWHSKPHFPAPFLQTLPVPIMPLKGAPRISLHLSTHTVSTLPPNSASAHYAAEGGTPYLTASVHPHCQHPSSKLCQCPLCCWRGHPVSHCICPPTLSAPFLQTLPVPIMPLKWAPRISLHLSTHTVSTLQRAGLLTWLWIQTNMTVNTTQQWSTHLNTRCIHPTQTFHKCYGGCWQHQTYWVISADRWDNKCPFNGEAIYGRV